MKLEKAFYFLILINVSTAQDVFGQDTLRIKKKTVDTVYIQKDPVIIRKSFVMEDAKSVSKKWSIDFFIGPGYVINHISPCPGFQSYSDTIRKAFTRRAGFLSGISLSRTFKHFCITATSGLTFNRENFIYTDSYGSNFNFTDKYSYFDLALLVGYKVGLKKIAWIPSAGIMSSKLISEKGYAVNHHDYSVENLKEAHLYHSYNYQIITRSRISYQYSDIISLYVEPSFRMDIRTITRDYIPFKNLRNTVAFTVGTSFCW